MNMNNTTTPESEQDCAQTPWWFIKSLESFTNLEIDLDVCAAPNTAKAEGYCSQIENEDGLLDSWELFNYCNPPYSDITPWIEKAAKESKTSSTTLMLIPDKPEVGYTRR